MDAVVLCGIQGSGKTTWYERRLARTHVRISLDALRTRTREAAALRAAIEAGVPFAVDGTNPTAAERRRYVEPARTAGYRVACAFFETRPRDAIARNAARAGRARIPVAGILGTYNRLERPRPEEGFDEILVVRAVEGRFEVETAWPRAA